MRPTASPLIILLALTLTGCDADREPAHVAIVVDLSNSFANPCGALGGVAARALSDPDLDWRSTVIILVAGSSASANEPMELGRYQVPQKRRAMGSSRQVEARRQKILANIQSQCRAHPRSNTTPMRLGAQRGLEHLQALGCRLGSSCKLYLITDGEETVDPTLSRALRGSQRALRALTQPAPHPGIKVGVCGVSETLGTDHQRSRRRLTAPRTAARLETHRQVWTKALGGTDGLVFEPFCPKTEIPVAGALERSR